MQVAVRVTNRKHLTKVLLVTMILSVSGLEVHKSCSRSNVSISFLHKLSNSANYMYELFTLNQERPFCSDGQIDQTALQPGQYDRFAVNDTRAGSNLNVTLFIFDAQDIDTGVYILALKETSGQTTNHIYDAYLKIWKPAGKANCTIKDSEFSKFVGGFMSSILGR